MKKLGMWLGVMVLAVLAVQAQSIESVELNIGGRVVTIPLPEGNFQRCDGINARWDEIAASFVPATNRQLVHFGTQENRDVLSQGRFPNFEKTYFIQTMKDLEAQEIGDRAYSEVRDQMKKGLLAVQTRFDEEVEKSLEASNQNLKGKIGHGFELKANQSMPLGIFEDATNSLGFSMALKAEAKTDSARQEDHTVVSTIITPINGRLLFLYHTRPYQTEADQKNAETSLMAWRNSIRAVNPKVEGSSAALSNFYGIGKNVGYAAIIGGVIGGMVALVASLVKKFRARSNKP